MLTNKLFFKSDLKLKSRELQKYNPCKLMHLNVNEDELYDEISEFNIFYNKEIYFDY